MKKAVVTGGGGFVGKAVVKQLLSRGIETTVIGRNPYPDVEKIGANVQCGDIRDARFMRKTCKGHDIVFHVAAKAGIWGSYEDYYSINVQGTENVLDSCRQNNIPALVYTSTPSVVFRNNDLQGVDEKTPYAESFLCHYARTKVLAEKKVLAANSDSFKTTALRPHLVWGPGDTNLIPRLVDRGLKKQLKIVGAADNLVDISYIDNVAHAHLLAADNLHQSASAQGQAYFISQGEPVNLWNWINDLFKRLDIPPVTRRISFKKAYLAGTIIEKIYLILKKTEEPPMTRFLAEQLARSHWFSIDNARKDLGYQPKISTREGINNLVAWLKPGNMPPNERDRS